MPILNNCFMKKIYILPLLFVFTSQVNAQNNTSISVNSKVNQSTILTSPVESPKPSTTSEKALGQVFYKDCFDSTVVGIGSTTGIPSSWTPASNGTQTGPTYGWNVNATEESWYFNTVIAGGGAGNLFAEVNNGTSTTPEQAVVYTLTMNNGIDIQTLAGNEQVTLSFKQYGAHFNDEQSIQLSTDNGVSFVTVYTNNNKPTLSTTNTTAAYANPETVSVNLAPYLAGQPLGNVILQLSWTSQFPTSTSPNAWITYGWMVDDITLETNPTDEVAVNEVFIGDIVNDFSYSIVPVEQTTPFMIGVSMMNNGINDFVNSPITISIKLNGNEVDNFDELVTLNSGVTDTFWITSTYTPSTVGDYTIDVSIPADDISTNNTGTSSISTSNYIWAHDFGGTTARGFNIDDENAIGNLFLPNVNGELSALNINFATGTTVGQEVEVAVYEVLTNIQGNLNFITETYYTILASDISAPSTTIEFGSPVTVEAGKVYLMYAKKPVGTNRMYISGTLGDNDYATACFGPFGTGGAVNWYNGFEWAPHVRANFDPSLAIENVSMLDGVSVYPNPSEGIITVSNDNGVENTITVYDITGKKVASKVANTSTTVDLSAMGTGVYMVEVANENGKKSERVIIK